MFTFYLLALLPIVVGGILWVYDRNINWMEWVGGSAFALIAAIIMHIIAFKGMTDDVETLSGQLVQATHDSAWTEYYEWEETAQKNIGTSKNPNYITVHVAWIPTTEYHPDSYGASSNINTSYSLSSGVYSDVRTKFGGEHAVSGVRFTLRHNSRMISGDPDDYVSDNKTGVNIPVTSNHTWTNRVKAAPSVFSYAPVPAGTPIFAYPTSDDPFVSKRLLGCAGATVSTLAFDQMNARLGPAKHVNVILVGFVGHSPSLAKYQEAAWVGGKKNDIVICYGYDDPHPDLHTKPDWVICFGWAEHAVIKHDLEDIFLASPKGITDDIIPTLEQEVATSWQIKDWHKFDYINISPPTWSYFAFIGFLIVSQGGWYFWCHQENFGKSDEEANLFSGNRGSSPGRRRSQRTDY